MNNFSHILLSLISHCCPVTINWHVESLPPHTHTDAGTVRMSAHTLILCRCYGLHTNFYLVFLQGIPTWRWISCKLPGLLLSIFIQQLQAKTWWRQKACKSLSLLGHCKRSLFYLKLWCDCIHMSSSQRTSPELKEPELFDVSFLFPTQAHSCVTGLFLL